TGADALADGLKPIPHNTLPVAPPDIALENRDGSEHHSTPHHVLPADKARFAGEAIEAELSPHMLYFTNDDKPGLIGGIGLVLGAAEVNIATFNLGRAAAGGDAIGLISVDSDVSEQVLNQLRGIPNIVQVKALRF
ncbi:MAG: hypothetical protein VCB06_08350, partial [Alphaproteobacteria bacterium]